MSDAFFDTTVFIDAYNGHKGAEALAQRVVTGSLTASYSPMTVFELWTRPMLRQEEMRHRAFLALLEEACFDSGSARLMASWIQTASASRSQRLTGDAIIAATAASRGELIYTRNVRDFLRLYPDVRSY